MIAEECSTRGIEKENSMKKGPWSRRVALQTYFGICFCLVFIVTIEWPDTDLGNSASESAKNNGQLVEIKRSDLVLPHSIGARSLELYDAQCAGKRLYMFEIPSKFNTGLAELCENVLVEWLDICRHFQNAGFGPKLEVDDDDEGWSDWYATDAYMLEVIFHARMETYPCRTYDPSRADAFFVPWYSGLDALPWLYNKKMTVPERGRFGKEIFEWIEYNAGEWWRRYGGHDFWIILGRTAWDFSLEEDVLDGWGTGFFSLPHAQNLTSLTVEKRSPSFDYERAIPYPTSFHPSSSAALSRWIQKVQNAERDYLMSYVGAPRPQMDTSIRGIIGSHCADAAGKTCLLIDCSEMKCSHNPIPISKSLLRSNFCLQPRGDSATRRSTFDCMIAGSIPVFFHEDTAYTQYKRHLPENRENYSVYIPETELERGVLVKHILMSYSPERIREMRNIILALIPRLVYNNFANPPGSETKDAFELSIEGVIDRAAAYKRFHPSI